MQTLAILILSFTISSSLFSSEKMEIGSIILNAENGEIFDKEQIVRYLLGKEILWEESRTPTVIAYQDDKRAIACLEKLTGMNPDEFEQLWSRLNTEGANPLKRFSNRGALVAFVSLNRGAIGIVSEVHALDYVKRAH